MKPGLRKVAALILATATLFGSGASAVSAAYADDTTMGTSTRIQTEPDVKTTTGGDEAATKPDTGSGDEAGTGADEQSGTGAPAQSAPQADAGQAAPDVTIHDMLDTDSAAVSRLRLTDRITGTAPFDKDNERGDDKDETNDIVRSYDTVTYDYEYTLTPDSTMDYYRRTRVGFRFELPYPQDRVTFDAEKMGWVDHTPGYEPKLTTETIDGTVTQVYTCYRLLEPTSQSPTVNPGTGSIGLSVAVKGAPHGYRFHPTVKAWTAWDASNPTNTGTHKRAVDTPKDVTVSAKLSLNVRMVDYGNVDRGVFDFSSGAANAPNRTEGKVTGLGLGVALVTEMRWPDRTKGLKGLEAPSGRITYKLRLSNQYSDDTKTGTKHPMERRWQPLLYDYGHIDNMDSKYGRTFAWMGDLRYRVPGVADRADGNDRVARGNTTITTTTGGQGTDVTVSFDGYDTSVLPIHNKFNGTQNKCSTDYMTSGCSTMQVGAIHTDVLQFITPTSRDGRTVAQYYGNVDQTANITMDDMGLTATGVSGDRLATAEDNSNQASTGDDHAGSAMTVRMPGTYSTRIRYTCWNNEGSWNDAGTSCDWTQPDYGNGSDSLIQGSKLRLQIGHNIIINSEGDAEVMGMGLVKLDPNSIEPVDDHPDTQPTIPMNVWTWGARAAKRRNAIPYWYAVKKDGTGWKDYREQRDTKISGLDYYPTLNEAKTHGTVVGMLFEDHNTVDPTGTSFNRTFTPIVSLPARILDTARIGTVTPIVADTAYWTRKTLARTANLNADASNTQWQQWSDNLTTRLPEYANGVKPDLAYSGDTYRPATFDENGVYQPADTADFLKGDSLYVAGETPHIAKQVEQTNEAGNAKTVYDLDKEQRAVDWKLTATADTSTTTDGGQYTTDYIITDTLPKGLTYVDGSMTVGGQYSQHTPDKGTVTGGTPVTPTIVVNKDGATTMTIRVNGARADSGTQTVIHYSTTIGDASDPDHDVRNNDSFTNHATIQSKRNMAPPLAPKAQIADATIRVSRTRASALATRADPLLNDINRPLGFRNMLGNFSKDEKTDPYAVDVMPCKGLNQSNYHGDYALAGLTVKAGAGASMNGVKVYFTTDPKWRNVDATKITREQVQQWTEATVNATTGKVTIPDGYSKPVAWAFTSPSLPANARYDFSLSIKPTGNSASDMYARVLNRSATPCLGLEVFEVSNLRRCRTHGSTVFAPVVRGEDPDREAALRAASEHSADRGGNRSGQVHGVTRAEARPVVRVQRERVVPSLPAETAEDRGMDLGSVLFGAGRAEEGGPAPARIPQAASHGLGPASRLGAGLAAQGVEPGTDRGTVEGPVRRRPVDADQPRVPLPVDLRQAAAGAGPAPVPGARQETPDEEKGQEGERAAHPDARAHRGPARGGRIQEGVRPFRVGHGGRRRAVEALHEHAGGAQEPQAVRPARRRQERVRHGQGRIRDLQGHPAGRARRPHVGQRHGGEPAHAGGRGAGHAHVLRRPVRFLAAWQQREQERQDPPLSAQRNRVRGLGPGGPRRDRR